ncbi:MAG: 6,7-dimethyl-8-ribityllumazine synthase [Proteobacteria bacterium]|nr:6,7-dimethyl-8-ribityllumazine synthase [Pseudomonadota bacterium]
MRTVVDVSALAAIENPGRICILQSKWYPEFVGSMSEACQKVLSSAGYTDIQVHTLPGSLEMPLAARDLLAEDSAFAIDAIICFGVIIKGDTLHFEMISTESMRGLGSVMHDFRRPVVVEILPVFNKQQAIDRSSDDEFNKGIEAAVAAIEMVAWRRAHTG